MFLQKWFTVAPQLMKEMFAEDMVELLRGLYDHKVASKDIDRRFIAAWQEEAVMKSDYFPKNLSFEIRNLFKHWKISIHGNLMSKLQG